MPEAADTAAGAGRTSWSWKIAGCSPPFQVTSNADNDDTGTLRWAVAQANVATAASQIELELGTNPATITLTSGQLELSNTKYAVTIYTGPARAR